MSDDASIDLDRAHRHFAPACFNQAWELLDEWRDESSDGDRDRLVLSASSSLWHWMQRDDVTAKNRSVGAWLLARVYCVVDRPQEAVYWADRSLHFAEKIGDPFYLGYAYEAFARAYGEQSKAVYAERYLVRAREQLEAVQDEELRALLQTDLDALA